MWLYFTQYLICGLVFKMVKWQISHGEQKGAEVQRYQRAMHTYALSVDVSIIFAQFTSSFKIWNTLHISYGIITLYSLPQI